MSHNPSFILRLSNDEKTLQCDDSAGPAIDTSGEIVLTMSDHVCTRRGLNWPGRGIRQMP